MDIHENEEEMQEVEPLSSDPQPASEPEQEQPEEETRVVDPVLSDLDPEDEQDSDEEELETGEVEGEDAAGDDLEFPVVESIQPEFLEDLPVLEPEADTELEEEVLEDAVEPEIEESDELEAEDSPEPVVEDSVGPEVEDLIEAEVEDSSEAEVEVIKDKPLENFGIVDTPFPEEDETQPKTEVADPYASVTVPHDPVEVDGRAWYVIHCYSGNEDKVRHNILQRIESMSMDNLIFDVVVPTEDEVNIKNGERQTVEKKVFPGYILVYMVLTEESWYMVRNTPGVTGFVGMGNDPTALQPEEVARILKRMESKSPRINVTFRTGERVRIVDGPFEDFYGKVSEIDMERATVRVMVNFFGRETPVELDFLQVEEA